MFVSKFVFEVFVICTQKLVIVITSKVFSVHRCVRRRTGVAIILGTAQIEGILIRSCSVELLRLGQDSMTCWAALWPPCQALCIPTTSSTRKSLQFTYVALGVNMTNWIGYQLINGMCCTTSCLAFISS